MWNIIADNRSHSNNRVINEWKQFRSLKKVKRQKVDQEVTFKHR